MRGIVGIGSSWKANAYAAYVSVLEIKNHLVLSVSSLAYQNLLQILCFGACDPFAVGLIPLYLARDGAAR